MEKPNERKIFLKKNKSKNKKNKKGGEKCLIEIIKPEINVKQLLYTTILLLLGDLISAVLVDWAEVIEWNNLYRSVNLHTLHAFPPLTSLLLCLYFRRLTEWIQYVHSPHTPCSTCGKTPHSQTCSSGPGLPAASSPTLSGLFRLTFQPFLENKKDDPAV